MRPALRAGQPPQTARTPPRPSGGPSWLPLVVIGAALGAYHNAFQNPFQFDDQPHILRNPHIRHLWPPWEAIVQTTRPLVQLSLALNYAVSGLDVWSYHAVNLAIHALAALALLGVIRRTLMQSDLPDRYRSAATGLALAAALIWVVHPLQTEAVTYVIQRSESLAGLFYLLTLYCVIRGADSSGGKPWHAAAVVSCALGMASKPIMTTAPLAVLIYDRMFLSRSFRQLWSQRRMLYIGLFGTMGLLPLLFANGPLEWRTSAGLRTGITPLAYAMTEPGVILHYLRLCLWPHPLCLDYGWPIAKTPSAVWAPALIVAALVIAAFWSSSRGYRLGFLGVWFFLILAPTSSFIPVSDPAFEHRLYLPLAAVSVLATLGGYEVIHRVGRRSARSVAWARGVAVGVVAVLVATLAALSVRRNEDYRSDLAMWVDVVAKRPENPRARTNLGLTLFAAGKVDEALAQLKEALRLDPHFATAHLGLGYCLSLMGRSAEALPHLREAVRLFPDDGEAQFLLGTVLFRQGAVDEAYTHLIEAIRFEPDRPATHYNMGLVLESQSRWGEAIQQYSEAVRLKPDYANAHCNLGVALARMGRLDEARRELETALALRPDHPEASQALENVRRLLAPP